MSRESARRFVEVYATDQAIKDAIDALPEGTPCSMEALMQIAVQLGYEFTSDELQAEFEEDRSRKAEATDGVELSEDELREVAGAGGPCGNGWRQCISDYDYNDWCWFNDRCTGMSHVYPQIPGCHSTYDPAERCLITDLCDKGACHDYP